MTPDCRVTLRLPYNDDSSKLMMMVVSVTTQRCHLNVFMFQRTYCTFLHYTYLSIHRVDHRL